MILEFIGHACFKMTAQDGTTLITDPYKPGAFDNALRYDPVDVAAQIVTSSHDHDDHWYDGAVVEGADVVREPGTFTCRGVKIMGIETKHDESGGADRGGNIVFKIELDDLAIVHLGDLGHMLLPDHVAAVGRTDVLLAPVGGFFTIDRDVALTVVDALNPRIVVPMHFKTDKVDFPIAPVDDFLAVAPKVDRKRAAAVEIDAGSLPDRTETWVLDPSH